MIEQTNKKRTNLEFVLEESSRTQSEQIEFNSSIKAQIVLEQ